MSGNEMKIPEKGTKSRYVYRMVLGFSLFLVFFIYYMWVAIINTPPYKEFASTIVAGIPLGMFLTLLIFPLSFVLVIIYYFKWR
jgi:TRAP-type C4-dicarboxylate transport system permease small subunit